MSEQTTTTKGNKVLKIERTVNAPRELVWKAWTDPTQLSRWWSPAPFTVPRCELDVRPQGAMRVDMQGPDGTVYPMTGVYEEVSEPDKLTFISSVLDSDDQVIFKVHHTILFDAQGDTTVLKLVWEVIQEIPAAAQYLVGMEPGLNQSLDNLERVLIG